MRQMLYPSLSLAVAALPLGCESSSGSSTASVDAAGTPTSDTMMMMDGTMVMDGMTSTCGAGADTYAAGMSKTGPAGLTVAIVSATPGPPEKGNNAWVFEVKDASGALATGAAIKVSPYMVQHQHGTVPPDYEATTGSDGRASIGPVDIFMPGLWELRIHVTAGTTEDDVVFAFCIAG